MVVLPFFGTDTVPLLALYRFERAISGDIILLPIVFVIMTVFISFVFWNRKDKFVVVAFTALFCACGYSASTHEQSFDVRDSVPSDSYLIPFADLVEDWYTASELDFNDQVDAFLSNSVHGKLYGEDIIRDDSGSIVSSRCIINMDSIELGDVNGQIDALEDQRAIISVQPVNQGEKDWKFFTFDGVYNIWEFYAVSSDELTLTTIVGVVAVTGVAFLLVPHWTAATFALPLIVILYVDLLGVMQLAGITINPISYISLVLSIGLLVDSVMHGTFHCLRLRTSWGALLALTLTLSIHFPIHSSSSILRVFGKSQREDD